MGVHGKGQGSTLWLVAGVIAFAGCGETSDQPAPPPRGGAVDDVFEKLVEAYCKALFECPVPNDDTLSQALAFGSQARCRDVLSRAGRSSLVAGWEDLRRRERDGSIRVDSDAVDRCFAQPACEISFARGACREMFVGTVAEGQPCFRNEQCTGNAYCDHSQAACPGVCRARKAPGSPCSFGEECSAPGGAWTDCHYDNASGGSTCIARVLRSAAEGQACTPAPGAAAEIVLCTPGLWCDEAPDGTGVCRKPLPVGQGCDSIDDVCVAGAFCHGPAGQQTCQTMELAGVGKSCTRLDTEPPRICDVYGGATCDTDSQTCTATGGSRGSRCDISDLGDLIPCDAGLYCDGTTRSCQPQVADGQPCASDRQCNSGQCGSSTPVCVATYCDH